MTPTGSKETRAAADIPTVAARAAALAERRANGLLALIGMAETLLAGTRDDGVRADLASALTALQTAYRDTVPPAEPA